MLFGHPAPFDRHDWTVDRGGKEVRYIIDYYHDEAAVQQQKDRTPQHMKDAGAMQSIKVDVRPALDDASSIFARLFLMPLRRMQGNTKYNPPPFFAPKLMLKAEENKVHRINADWTEIKSKCSAKKDALAGCTSEEQCRAASVALQVCTASVVCPDVASAFLECTAPVKAANSSAAAGSNSSSNNSAAVAQENMKKAAASYSALVQCLELFEIDSKKLLSGGSGEEKGVAKDGGKS